MSSLVSNFRENLPQVALLDPSQDAFKARRATRGVAGQEHAPLAIAAPRDAAQVAQVVKWATSQNVDIAVRSGGNEFYGRNAVNGGLVVDMRDIKSIVVASDRKTVTIGGGVITGDLVTELEGKGLVTPVGNLQILGFVGWATFGGYGPFQHLLGMGFEGIVGAELVNARGEVVRATEEMLEGIRGLGGNLGIITAITVKCYPARELFSGMLMFDATPENILRVVETERKLGIPKPLTLHHFVLEIKSRVLVAFFTWTDGDIPSAKAYVDLFLKEMPEPKGNTTAIKTWKQHMDSIPLPQAPWGGQRAIHVRQMTTTVLDTIVGTLPQMPPEVNLGWTQDMELDGAGVPPNCYGSANHVFVSLADMVSKEDLYPRAKQWSDDLWSKIRGCGDDALLETGYAPLTRPGDRSAKQLLGSKWERARLLKDKYDPDNVFKHAIPDMSNEF